MELYFIILFLALYLESPFVGTSCTDKIEFGNCRITASECSSIRCMYGDDWRDATCIECKRKYTGTKIIWTFQNRTELPPNVCVLQGTNKSTLKLPPCFTNKKLNEGTYTCNEINISTNKTKRSEPRYMKVYDSQEIRKFKRSEVVEIGCGYSYCADRYVWKFSKKVNGSYGTLPKGMESIRNHTYLWSDRMAKNLEGYYKCEIESNYFGKKYYSYKLEMEKVEKQMAKFTTCEQRKNKCADKYYQYSCYGILADVEWQSSILVGVSCPSLGKYLNKTSFSGAITNDKPPYKERYKGFLFWANASNNSFEVSVKVDSLESFDTVIRCNFTLENDTVHRQFRQFQMCFTNRKSVAMLLAHIFFPIGVVIILLLMSCVYRKFEYEIRLFLYQKCVKSSSKRNKYFSLNVLLVYAPEREELAQNLKEYLQNQLPNSQIKEVFDGRPGEDVGHGLERELNNTAVVIFIMEDAAFSRQPSIFENALTLSLDHLYIQRMYIFLEKDYQLPRSFRGTDFLLADITSRDRKVVWSEPLLGNLSCLSMLLKKLRLQLEKYVPMEDDEDERDSLHMGDVPRN